LEQPVIRLRQAIVLHAADGRVIDPAPDPALPGQRQPGIELPLVRRLAKQEAREDMSASPCADEELLRDVARAELVGNVHRRVAHANDEPALAPEVERGEGIAIGMGVDLRAVEMSGISRLRPAAIPMVPVADEERVIGMRLAVCEADLPRSLPVTLRFGDF